MRASLVAQNGKASTCNAEFDPWVGMMLQRKGMVATPVFLPRESHGQRNLADCRVHGVTGSQARLSDSHTHTHTHTHKLSGGSGSKESACSAGNTGWTPGWGRLPGEGNGYPVLYSCLENPHGQRTLVSYCPRGGNEFEATERLTQGVTECVLFTCKGQGTDR